MKNQESVPIRSRAAAKLPLSNLLLPEKPKYKQLPSHVIYKSTVISLFSKNVGEILTLFLLREIQEDQAV